MDCRPPGSSVHGILQARILEWVAFPCSRGSSWPRDWTWVSCIAVRFFPFESPGKPKPLRFDVNQIPYDYTVEVVNRLMGLDMLDSVWRLWTEVCNTVQEAVTKTIPKKKKFKKAKWLSEEALQIAFLFFAKKKKKKRSKRQSRKGKIYPLNADFQRSARRDKSAS